VVVELSATNWATSGAPVVITWNMAKKVDQNQKVIVAALRDVGCTVQLLHTVGRGCPDIIAGTHGVNYLIEIKNGELSPSRQKLTPDEQGWHNLWRGQVDVVNSIEQALNLVRREYANEL